MRVPIAFLAAAASFTTSFAAPPTPVERTAPKPRVAQGASGSLAGAVISSAPRACVPLSQHARGRDRLGARKLVDAPPADLHLAVDRRVGGCPVPVVAGHPR